MNKHFLIFILFGYLITNVFSLTIGEKVEITRKVSAIDKLIDQKQLIKAHNELSKMKQQFNKKSEFTALIYYYTSKIDYLSGKNYAAEFSVNLAIENIDENLLDNKYKSSIYLLAADIYRTIGIYEKSNDYYYKVLKHSTLYDKNKAFLYLTLYFYNNELKDKAAFYFADITPKTLNDDDISVYKYLDNFLGWEQADTMNWGYKDPNIASFDIINDSVYIGLWNGGLFKYNYLTGNHVSINCGGTEIRDISSGDKNIYIAMNGNFSSIDKRTGHVKDLPELNGINCSKIEVYNEVAYIGTLAKGVIIYDSKKNKIDSLLEDNISLTKRSGEYIYVGTYSNKFYKIDPKDNSIKEIYLGLKSPVTDLIEINNTIYLSTFGNGIIKLNNKERIESAFLKNEYVLTMTTDNLNKIYCGTLGNGIYVLDGDNVSDFPTSVFFESKDIVKLKFYQGRLFIGTLGNGLIIKRIQYK